jgi:hypothetical protein
LQELQKDKIKKNAEYMGFLDKTTIDAEEISNVQKISSIF